MPRVAIVIVTYNSGHEIAACLDSLATVPDAEIVVVDNASWDTTIPSLAHRPVRVVANSRNLGFAAAVNQGVAATSAPFVLLLNPDASLAGSLDPLLAPFTNPKTGAAGGLLVGPDGKPQTGFMARNLPTLAALIFEVLGLNRLFPRNPVNWHYRCLGNRQDVPSLVGQPAGAFLMFSRDAFVKVGGFDEQFFPVWFEDVDFCAKLQQSGFLVWFVPDAVASHKGGHSVGTLALEIREQYWYGSLLKYAAKYYRSIDFRAVCCAVLLGAVFRAAVRGLLKGGGWKAVQIYSGVARMAAGQMFSAVRRR